jgi:hypothetical protein
MAVCTTWSVTLLPCVRWLLIPFSEMEKSKGENCGGDTFSATC